MIFVFLQENGSPEEHAIYVWDHFIAQSAAENVFFVAHSYGGLAFVELVSARLTLVLIPKLSVGLSPPFPFCWYNCFKSLYCG